VDPLAMHCATTASLLCFTQIVYGSCSVRSSGSAVASFTLAAPSVRNRDRIELPFGRGKTSPVAAADVAQVVAVVLAEPVPHLGLIYELTGPQSQDMDGVAREFSDALNREIAYSDISPEKWEQGLRKQNMPEHLTGHLLAMGELHWAGRYDTQADGVPRMTGQPAMSVREFVSLHAKKFGGRRA
jgi:NAD(P)H dehydrogenase (quinone)